MKHKFLFILLFSLVLEGMVTTQAVAGDYVHQVNTLIGTKGTGLTSGYLYPGATYPYGMVQFTPSYFSKRSGFVINQLSGGGCEHMGNFPTFPVKGKLKMSPDNILNYRINVSEEKGHAGYYEAMVQEDIKAKLTVTERTGMASYEYPADQQYGTIIIGGGISATPIEQAAIVITAPNKCEGYAEGGNFCGLRTPYKVYFVAEFDTDAFETGTWKREELMPNTAAPAAPAVQCRVVLESSPAFTAQAQTAAVTPGQGRPDHRRRCGPAEPRALHPPGRPEGR